MCIVHKALSVSNKLVLITKFTSKSSRNRPQIDPKSSPNRSKTLYTTWLLGSGRHSIGFAAQFWSTPRSQYPRIIFLDPFQQFFDIFRILYWSDFQFFSKKSIPCGRSGQSVLWNMIIYWSSRYEVFIPKCRKHVFLRWYLQVFRKTHFSILSHLRGCS